MLNVSIGVMAYNEAGILSLLLEALRKQKTKYVNISEIIVVASGCTDDTIDIVKRALKKNKKLKLFVQKKREGKASAINLFLKHARSKLCVVESGDTIPLVNTVEKLVIPFFDEDVGMTGTHPIPVNKVKDFVSFAACFNWTLTHALSMYKPRLGEMIAFRRVFKSIPENTTVDEACIEALIDKMGLRIVYCPNAIVRNKAPETISDYLKQGRRIYAGHLRLEKTFNYRPASKNLGLVLQVLLERVKLNKTFFYIFGAVGLEAVARFLGMVDFYLRRKNPFIWEIAESTKKINESITTLSQVTGH